MPEAQPSEPQEPAAEQADEKGAGGDGAVIGPADQKPRKRPKVEEVRPERPLVARTVPSHAAR